ncbi:MAG: hypothetical protein SFV51_19665 [Bryobacteraceae bacterium]|nr:hypothetical protein [Bryobacteraceae bacterium]
MRRRTVTQLLLDHGNLALIAALAGLVLLILTGTQVLDWYWPILLLLIFFGIGVWRLKGAVPSDYELAQKVDARLELHDVLSTAYFFSTGDVKGNPHPAVVDAQRQQAEKAAALADPVLASPVHIPRRAWVSVALVAVSVGLLIARYGLRGDLDLSQPLVHIPFDTFLSQPEVVAKRQSVPKQKLPKGVETIAVPSEATEERTGEKQNAMEEETMRAESVPSDAPGDRESQKGKGDESGEQGGKESAEAEEKGDGSAGGDEKNQKSGSGNSPGKENAKSPQGNNQNSQQQPGDNSLMDKMRDAMANMLSRMRQSQQANEGGQKNQSAGKGAPQSASAKDQAGKKGAPSPGKMQGEGQQPSDQEGEQQGEGASKNMSASNRTDGVSDKQAPQEGKSGAGKQDGEKDIKAAEQQAAMGKISELLGKRAKDLTGEVMVEVSSGRQQLKTQMSQRSASHADTGGEISRDEVPAAYQDFVQQYFEELRKPAPGKAKPVTQ